MSGDIGVDSEIPIRYGTPAACRPTRLLSILSGKNGHFLADNQNWRLSAQDTPRMVGDGLSVDTISNRSQEAVILYATAFGRRRNIYDRYPDDGLNRRG